MPPDRTMTGTSSIRGRSKSESWSLRILRELARSLRPLYVIGVSYPGSTCCSLRRSWHGGDLPPAGHAVAERVDVIPATRERGSSRSRTRPHHLTLPGAPFWRLDRPGIVLDR